MNRNLVSLVGMTLLIVGALLLVRLRPSGMAAGQAGVAYLEQPDGTMRRASAERPDQRTQPADAQPAVPSDPHSVPSDPHSVPSDPHSVASDPHGAAASSKSLTAGAGPAGSDKPWLTEFELTERSGKLVSSRSFLGQPYVVGFFYATCPSICVRQNEKVKILQEKFKGQPIRLVEISCDPEVDRPEVLAEYANRFQADPEQWLFFTGEMDYISRVGSEMYQIGIMRRGHPEKFALVDAQGKIYGYYTWSDPGQWQALQRDMTKLVSELPK